MNDRPARRVVLVVLGYLAVGWLVLFVADRVAPLFALPGLFDRLLRLGLVAGLPAAAILAWRYPTLGHHGVPPGRPEEPGRKGGEAGP